jgi:hypothetical protein
MAVPYDAASGGPEPENGHQTLDAMRSWLVNGVQLVDRRRRLGSHGRARELLVVDRPTRSGASERWETLAAALHRHTVRGGLSRLSQEERRVISLAYLEGRTNREIAAILGVSVTTARRRLLVALERLEDYLGRTGGWLSVLIVAFLVYAVNQATRLGGLVTTAAGSADRAQRVAATMTAGAAVAAAAVGIVAFTYGSGAPSKPSPATAAPLIAQTAVGAFPSGSPDAIPFSIQSEGGTTTSAITVVGSSSSGSHPNNGCDGNPTSAPPHVPVGSRSGQPSGAPVTHPSAGGCKA